VTPHPLDEVVTAQHSGVARGVTSICSAHPTVLDTAVRHGAAGEHVVLIEATCNQVNQDGGYTGMTAADFRHQVEALADAAGLDRGRLLLGGDHLGPNPWRGETAAHALDKAAALVRSFVEAGFSKIHLDASMRCADDPTGPLPPHVVAERTAQLATVAEAAAADDDARNRIRYVIGTEVPVPGGESAGHEGIHVTATASADETIQLTRSAFESRSLGSAWDRVRALVAQPGVEFSDRELHDYDSAAAQHLVAFIDAHPQLVFEAHSTDYQTVPALTALVHDRFAILKVGPALTFAYREGVFALAALEDELLGRAASHVCDALDAAMLADPSSWQPFYQGDEQELRRARRFSRSDRSRYYWPADSVRSAVATMVDNLRRTGVPEELASQYLPEQYRRFRGGKLALDPEALLADKVRAVLDDYLTATT